MSSKQHIIDVATRHQLFLQRYGGGQSKDAVKLLSRMRRDINARLMQEPTIFQAQRLTTVLNEIETIANLAFIDIGQKVEYGAVKLLESEAGFSVNLIETSTKPSAMFTVPSTEVLTTALLESKMAVNVKSAITIQDALLQFSEKKRKQILQTVTDGVALGDTTPVIAQKTNDLINTLNRRQLDTLVRTITNHSASVARQQVYDANSDIIEDYEWVSTLDNRTTLICGSRDGKKVNADLKGVFPPAHWGCRSTTIPIVKKQYDLGAELKGTRTARSADGGRTVSSGTTYGGWLKRQPVEFIDEALGVERSKLFRSGKLSISKFVDPTGRVYTLEQLKRMNPFVFIDDTIK